MLSANYRPTRAPPKRLRQTAESEKFTAARPSLISLPRRARSRPDGYERDRSVTSEKQNPPAGGESEAPHVPGVFSVGISPAWVISPKPLIGRGSVPGVRKARRLRTPDHPASPIDGVVWRVAIDVYRRPRRRRTRTWERQPTNSGRFRRKDFYNYLLLRTLCYDDVFRRSISDGVGQVVIIGAGTDTRAYRFRDALLRKRVRVIECDVPPAIRTKQRSARILGARRVRYTSLDVHSTRPWTWAARSGYSRSMKTLFLIEGVTPYVHERSFRRWLGFLARTACEGSLFACDYKIQGTDDDFGKVRGRRTMRMSRRPDRVRAFHNAVGLDVIAIFRSRELKQRYLKSTAEWRPVFDDDFIVIAIKP